MEKQILLLMTSLFVMCACSKKETTGEKETGYLTLNIIQGASLKADVEITDYMLRISDGQTEFVKERIGDLPEQIALPVGSYTVEAYSMEFLQPQFDMPFYSGKTTVEIEAGETNEILLTCSQGNAGVKVVWSNDFPKKFQTYEAQITCDEGYLHYSSEETRTGYFLPGTVSVTILADGQTINGGTITLFARDMVTANLRPKESLSGGLTIEISVDVTVNPREVEVIVDPDYRTVEPNSETNPYSIEQAIEHQGENGVWVEGYIVGATTAQNFVTGNIQATVLVLADDVEETSSTKTILVQLQSGTKPREDLNLVDNPENLYQKVAVKGNLATYSSRPGLLNTSDYSFK